MNSRIFCLVCSLAITLAGSATAAAQDFRVDTEIFADKEKEPFVETLTLFADGRVYDFLLTEPKEITIFDPQRGTFTLLAPNLKLKTVITTQEVLECCLALNTHAAQSGNSLFAFAAQPEFAVTEEAVPSNGETLSQVTLTAHPITYAAVGKKPTQADAARAFRQFADGFARLNAIRPGNLPPEPRLKLNAELADRGLLPTEITRIITPSNPLTKLLEHRSRHLVNWTLSRTDRGRIEQAGGYLTASDFRTVDFGDYCAADRQPAAEQQTKR